MPVPAAVPAVQDDEFSRILAERAVTPVFQPIVSLDDGLTVGFEALVRGPEGSRFATPDALFAEAERRGAVVELDWICGSAACAAALDAGLDVPLFLNVEPETFGTPPPPELADAFAQAAGRLDLVIEVTERVVRDPASLIRSVVGARRARSRIALDDVGVDPASLGMMALVRPDVIKLDRSLVQGRSAEWAQAFVVNAVLTEAGRTGAAVLAEGIETSEHLGTARGMGARLGQGWLFGRPGPLPATVVRSAFSLPRVAELPSGSVTPFGVVEDRVPIAEVTDQMLVPIGRLLEQMALRTDDATMFFATVPDRQIDGETRLTFNHIARRGVTVTAYGPELVEPGTGIQAVSVPTGDPLTAERVVIVIGSYFAAALVARTHPAAEGAAAAEPTYDIALTYDRLLVIEAARTLIDRIPPLPHGFGHPRV
ncbi:sensor domain-containing phosphodiesterase [Catellatospora citrea]|uniref:EAL domain-containing protein n=1 Tax=Catellatospora citrea TaxID=53366 RepID=A0A8J3KB59_9ACTN|nr:EAL domain-containing protein [Catellatospora citrea]RKE11482.1 EAL domain-containing protein (putative c-di-GMP-specific phosphodiesterase class I) [Catellatospora citrea]GIF99981.1 hypothetical protein Cci01nite_50750 [Catellatospora citrea]